MEYHTTDELYREMLHAEHSLRSLSDGCIGLRQKIVQRLSVLKPLLELSGLCLQFFIRHGGHRIVEGKDLIHLRTDHLELTVGMGAEHLLNYIHVLMTPLFLLFMVPGEEPGV